jgi:tetratricopeptide (TPR) repeat protein
LFNIKQEYDSALNYLQRAMELWVLLTKDSRVNPGLFYGRLGHTYLALRQYKLAYACYQTNLDYAKRFNSTRMISTAYYWLGKYHLETGNEDSALDYFQLALPFDEKIVGADYQVGLPFNLYRTFKEKGNDKEALKYLELYNNAKQKEDSLQQKHQMEVLSFEEDQRQQTVAAEKVKRAEERIRNLQYAAIALGLISFVILFFLLSRSVIANPKIIRFLGVFALLIVFEFIYLLIHPFIGNLTNYSPLLMLSVMVCIAAVLVPLHHRIEHSIIQRLVEKNNRIRLAAAKKTIAQLEGKVIDVPVEKSADEQLGL